MRLSCIYRPALYPDPSHIHWTDRPKDSDWILLLSGHFAGNYILVCYRYPSHEVEALHARQTDTYEPDVPYRQKDCQYPYEGKVEIKSKSREAILHILFYASCEKQCEHTEYPYEIFSIHSMYSIFFG